MKAILKFSFPEDAQEYEVTRAAHKLLGALHDISNLFRDHRKYNGKAVTESMFYDALKDNNVDLTTLI